MGVAQRSTTGKAEPVRRGEVLLGEDWVSPEALAEQELRAGKSRRGLVAGFDDDGALLLTSFGGTERVVAGDVMGIRP